MMVRWHSKRNLFLDIETSGLNPDPAVILSLALLVDSDGPEAGAVFEANILPTSEQWTAAHPKALEVNGMTWDFLVENGKPLEQVTLDLCNWLLDNNVTARTGYHVVGQNIQFDLKFLHYFMGKSLEFVNFPFYAVIDVMQLAKAYASINKEFAPKNFKGTGIANALGVKAEDDVHTAIGGVMAVRRNYVALMEHMDDFYKKIYATA